MSEKKELHSLCAAVVNEQAPRVGRNLVTWTARRSSLFDLRLYEDELFFNIDQ